MSLSDDNHCMHFLLSSVFMISTQTSWASLVAQREESVCSAADTGYVAGWPNIPGEESTTFSSILAWEIP